MTPQEHVPLAPLTTLGVGGVARFFVEAHSEEEVREAIAFAQQRGLALHVLGGGSNVLVPDAGVDGVVLRLLLRDMTFQDAGESVLLIAGAGARWEQVVDAAGARAVFGIENLAGIPGMLGGVTVQNIGAYGAEFSEVLEYADVIDAATGAERRVTRPEASFAYRTSFFKEHRELIVLRVAMRLARRSQPNIAYADLERARASGIPLATPVEIACAVRAIRAEKFPRTAEEWTAGSFFKNPVVSSESAAALAGRFPGMPAFPQENGEVKISLAWLLDHALSMKGYAEGLVRLYEKQPIVVIARAGATAAEVEAFAESVAKRVRAATGLVIEREVETFGAR